MKKKGNKNKNIIYTKIIGQQNKTPQQKKYEYKQKT